MEAVVEILLPWLKDDISSSDSSNPRFPSPEIELGEIFEFEVKDESDEVDTKDRFCFCFSSLFC